MTQYMITIRHRDGSQREYSATTAVENDVQVLLENIMADSLTVWLWHTEKVGADVVAMTTVLKGALWASYYEVTDTLRESYPETYTQPSAEIIGADMRRGTVGVHRIEFSGTAG